MKATIRTQGSQFVVEKGDKLFVNRTPNQRRIKEKEDVLMVVNKSTFDPPPSKVLQ